MKKLFLILIAVHVFLASEAQLQFGKNVNTTVTGTLSASDAVVAAPDGIGTIVSGASTSGSIVYINMPDGYQAWTVMIKGYTSGTVYTEGSVNTTNGTDGDWVDIKARKTGTAVGVEAVTYAQTNNGIYRGNAAGFKAVRARLIGGTGVSITLYVSNGMGATFLNSGIPTGGSIIGKVGIDQTTPGTTNAVSVTNASIPVTGTFFQTTQPVSIAANTPTLQAGSTTTVTQATGTNLHVVVDAAPTTAVTGAFFQATQPVSLATNTPILAAGTAVVGKVGIDQTTPGTTNAVSVTNTSLGVAGQTANSSAATAVNPVKIGGIIVPTTAATQDQTFVAGDAANMPITTGYQVIQKPFGSAETDWNYPAAAAGILNTAVAVTFKAASGTAGIRNYITGIQVMSEALGAATELAIRDGAAGTVLWRQKITTGGIPTGISILFPTPLRGTANTLLEVVTLTATTTGAVYFNAQGYTGF